MRTGQVRGFVTGLARYETCPQRQGVVGNRCAWGESICKDLSIS